MGGSIGEKIGEGAFADVHAFGPDQVIKLAKAGASRRVLRHEARMTRAVFAAGGPAPEVFEEVTVDGRCGIVMSRLDGPTLQHLSKTGAMSFEDTGAMLAVVCLSVHATRPPADVPALRDYMEHSLRLNAALLPEAITTGLLGLIDRLAPGDGLCHGDLHSGNVIMTAHGPRIIDWTGAVRGPAVLDLACCHIALAELAPAIVPDPERPIAVNAALQVEYARLTGVSLAALAADIEAYLSIARVLYLLSGAAPGQREWMIAKVLAALA
jgi:streptomycin 6-kinase